MLIIAHFESNLRSIESLVKHSENSQSDRPIIKIYKSIISALKISAIDKQNIFTFLDLMFTLRNAIHNNAIFFPYDKKDKIIDYKGRKYEFKIGENIMHYSYHETLFFLQELFEVIKLILSDEKINTATFSNKS